MYHGATRGSAKEEWLGFAQPRLLVSRRFRLDETGWRLDICSPFWRLYVQDRTGAQIEHEGRWLPLEPGRVYVLPAWMRFRTAVQGEVTQDYQHFAFHGLPVQLVKERCNRPFSLPLEGELAGLAARWGQGADRVGEPSLAAHGWALAFLHAVMAGFLDSLSEDDRRAAEAWRSVSARLAPALTRMDHPEAGPADNGELAKLCGFSATQFVRRFRAGTGMSPAQYRLERRVQAAARQLVATDDKIEVIAAQSGFSDRFHFTKVFKARIGFSPGAYRAMHRR
jgi:AraC-like DNA-binding protein